MGQLFREGRGNIEDEPRTGRTKSGTDEFSIELVDEFVRDDPCLLKRIIKYTEISTGSIIAS